MRKMRVGVTFGLLALAALLPLTAQAHDEENSKWKLVAAPLWGWAAGIDGDAQLGDLDVDIDMDFSDVVDDLDFMYSTHFEGRHQSGWGYGVEALFLFLSSDADVSITSPPAPAPIVGSRTTDTDVTLLEGFATRYLDLNDKNGLTFLFGARYQKIEARVTSDFGLTIEDDVSWFDGMAGVRWIREMNQKWQFRARGDLATGDSDLTWNASFMFAYDLSQRLSLGFGYRQLSYDYDESRDAGKLELDFALSGPLFGLEIHF